VIGNDTYAHFRRLPHLEREGRTYFLTFRTNGFWILPNAARHIALQCCIHDHRLTYWLHAAVVMPDHVHMLVTPFDEWRLPRITGRVMSVSAHCINRRLKRRGSVWQREPFDHILRSDESRRVKGEYIVMNPVRAGLVETPDAYPWIYRSWIEGEESAAEGGGATPTPTLTPTRR